MGKLMLEERREFQTSLNYKLPDLLLSVDRPSLVGLLDPRLALNNLCHGEHLSTSCVLGLQVTTQGPPPDPLALEQNKEDSLLSQI